MKPKFEGFAFSSGTTSNDSVAGYACGSGITEASVGDSVACDCGLSVDSADPVSISVANESASCDLPQPEPPFLGVESLSPTANIKITTAITRMNTDAQNMINFGLMVRSRFLAMS